MTNLTNAIPPMPFLSDSLYAKLHFVLAQVLLPIVSISGIVTNLINIVVYAKMGVTDTSTMNFLVLSLSDLVTVLCMLLTAVGHIPALASIYRPLTSGSLQILLVPLLYPVMAYSSCVTAIISTERCFCIVFPIKVRSVITFRRMLSVILAFLVFEVSSLFPHYAIMHMFWDVSPATNESILVLGFTEHNHRISVIIVMAFFSIPSLISFFTVVVCTSFLVAKLNQSLRWRKSTLATTDTASGKQRSVPVKEIKVVRSVVTICVIYIVCFFPNVMAMPVSLVYPKFHVIDPFLANVVFTVFFLGCVLTAVSSSVNILVYYNMSTKYKEIFTKVIFGKRS